MENAIEAIDLTKKYGELLAVDHINFAVKNGEIFGFLGPNGAGKTTTVRMLTGIIKPTSGEAYVMGYNIKTEILQAKQLMGIVPEMSNAYTDLSAWRNLMFSAELYGIPKHERVPRAEKLLKEFGLFERRNQRTKAFSKGMKQRLIICMALINDPEILFLDEPTSGLDVESTRIIKEKLRELNRNGATIFINTHNMEEANELCNRVAIMNHGKIVMIESPEKLRNTTRGLHSVEVVFDKPADPNVLLKHTGATNAKKVGDKVRLYTEDINEVISRLSDLAKFSGMKILTLNTLTPSLEDVFIKITEGEV
jgi:ABC-2 type transport system ATP-binding protein